MTDQRYEVASTPKLVKRTKGTDDSQIQRSMPVQAVPAEDVQELAPDFLERNAGGEPFTRDAVASLAARSWPGNVQELHSILEGTLARADGASDAAVLESCAPPPPALGAHGPTPNARPAALIAMPMAAHRVTALCAEPFLLTLGEWGDNRSAAAQRVGLGRKGFESALRSGKLPELALATVES